MGRHPHFSAPAGIQTLARASCEGGIVILMKEPRPSWDLPELSDGGISSHTELKEQRAKHVGTRVSLGFVCSSVLLLRKGKLRLKNEELGEALQKPQLPEIHSVFFHSSPPACGVILVTDNHFVP